MLDLSLGATPLPGGTRFRVWAPAAGRVDVHLGPPDGRIEPLRSAGGGYFEAVLHGVAPGDTYYLRLDGEREYPDPASRYQPQGVHGPSQVVSPEFAWHDQGWSPPPLEELIFYELHVGTFTPQGTFEAVLTRLDYLRQLGINAIELMPIAQFPGGRNWGYDGVLPFAAQDTYGGPDGLRRLVDGCHRAGIAVVLDVVYNHVGPEGNHLGDFGPYFTDAYKTPWGAAINYDGPGSDEVRRYFIESAVYWARDCHIDAFRLDAVHAIVDPTAYSFLEELTDALHAEAAAQGRPIYVIAESSLNDPRLVAGKERGGWGMDAFWNDDFHHAVHTQLTGEDKGYYADFEGIRHLAKVLREGVAYTGQYSRFRGRRHGRPFRGIPPERFVVSVQNHDQVGNRLLGERFGSLLSLEQQKLAGALLLLSPFLPLIFMGEEYGETAPFQYFVSHTEPELVEAVRRGRAEEFRSFAWQGEVPDPQDPATFEKARIDPLKATSGGHVAVFNAYQTLIRLRRGTPAFAAPAFERQEVAQPAEDVLTLRRWDEAGNEALIAFNLGSSEAEVAVELRHGRWRRVFDSADEALQGPGSLSPEAIDGGAVRLRLPPFSALMYVSA